MLAHSRHLLHGLFDGFFDKLSVDTESRLFVFLYALYNKKCCNDAMISCNLFVKVSLRDLRRRRMMIGRSGRVAAKLYRKSFLRFLHTKKPKVL